MIQGNRKYWAIAYWTLFAAWVIAGILNMAHVRGGFFTSYLADLTMPAWLYIVTRHLWTDKERKFSLLAWFGASPERSLISIFLGSATTELSTIYWPHGLFAGTFDPLDLAAYSVGLVVCYSFDKRSRNTHG